MRLIFLCRFGLFWAHLASSVSYLSFRSVFCRPFKIRAGYYHSTSTSTCAVQALNSMKVPVPVIAKEGK